MFYTYVLISKEGKRTYTGSTANLQERINEHNQGNVKSSKRFRPYELLHVETFDLLNAARAKEKFYKSTTGRRRLKMMVESWKRR